MRNLNSKYHRTFNGRLGDFLTKYCGYREYKESLCDDGFRLWVDTVEIFNLRFVKRVHYWRPPHK